jgi:hypothetical protein
MSVWVVVGAQIGVNVALAYVWLTLRSENRKHERA